MVSEERVRSKDIGRVLVESLKEMLLEGNRRSLEDLEVRQMLIQVLCEWKEGEIVETVRKGTDPTLTLRYEWERVFGQVVEPCMMFVSVGVKGDFGRERQVLIRGGYRFGRPGKKGEGRRKGQTMNHQTVVGPGEYDDVAFYIEGYLETDTQRKMDQGLVPISGSPIIQHDLAEVESLKASSPSNL
jgi:hypothetical protein